LPLLDFFRLGKLMRNLRHPVPKPEVQYTGDGFKMFEGLDDVKVVFEKSLKPQHGTKLRDMDCRLHIPLAGLPHIVKTHFLLSAEKEISSKKQVFLLCSQVK
jgi:hypothetical protein